MAELHEAWARAVPGVVVRAVSADIFGTFTDTLARGRSSRSCRKEPTAYAIASSARNLVTGGANLQWDLFWRDRALQTTRRVGLGLGGAEPNGYSDTPALSGDGQFLVFRSSASNLVASDTNGVEDAFVDQPLALATNYCGPAEPNSTGLRARMMASGSAVFAANNFTIHAVSLPPATLSLFLTSRTQAFIVNPGGSQGDLCLGGNIGRYVQHIFNTGTSGQGVMAVGRRGTSKRGIETRTRR